MDRLLLIIFFLLIPVFATANTCDSTHTESFLTFFDKFSKNKKFAVSRTLYPLRLRLWEYGLDEKGHDESSATLKFVKKSQDEKASSLSSYLIENNLNFKIKHSSQQSTNVEIFKKDTDWLEEYHFISKNHCWFLREIEDHSL